MKTEKTQKETSALRWFLSAFVINILPRIAIASPLRIDRVAFYLARSSQKATAEAAATLRLSTSWDMGIFTV